MRFGPLARSTFVERFGVLQPAPAPRFSRTPGTIAKDPPVPGEDGEEVLGRLRRQSSSAAG